jgi:hypothetical protein
MRCSLLWSWRSRLPLVAERGEAQVQPESAKKISKQEVTEISKEGALRSAKVETCLKARHRLQIGRDSDKSPSVSLQSPLTLQETLRQLPDRDIAASAGNGKRRAPNAFLSPPTGGTLFDVLLSNHSGCGLPRCDLCALPVQGIGRVGIVRNAAIARCANSL